MDQAGIISNEALREIDAVLRNIRDRGGPQINVLTLRSLDGLTIEDASIRITDAWKLGGAKKDDGVLFLISTGDRKLRIEVGQGLEGVLTDVESKRIIEDRIVPFFREGRPSDGIVVGVRAILEKTAPEYLKTLGDGPVEARKVSRHRKRGPDGMYLAFLVFFLIAWLFRKRHRSGWLGSVVGAGSGLGTTWSSGRGGWGSGGGSSWGGGGGGFSGGGASGSW